MYNLKGVKEKDNFSSSSSEMKKPTSIAAARIQKDISEDPIYTDCKINFPNKDNLLDIDVSILPKEGYYSGGKFDFKLTIPDDYPFAPPKVRCLNTVFHPNIDIGGGVCLNILKLDWKPVFTLNHIVAGLMNIFLEPNSSDPLNNDAGDLLRDYPQVFDEAVRLTMRGKRYKEHVYSYTYADEKRHVN